MANRDNQPLVCFNKGTFTLFFLSFVILCLFEVRAQNIPDRWDYEVTIGEHVEEMKNIPVGPFVRLGKNEILSASSNSGQAVLISEDNRNTWNEYPVFSNPDDFEMLSTAVQRTDEGVVILAFSNVAERHWTWSDELEDAPGARLPTYVVRSQDNGRTWGEPEMLHEEWTGENTDMIITRDGNIVFTSMMFLHNLGRHSVLTYISEDQGETWQRSNIIDLGGVGNHGGVTEATIEELQDGRLIGLMRTNWMELWRIESRNGGRSWHPMGPSGIPASSTHARLTRLESGRLLLVWNRPYPEGENSYPMRGGDNSWSAVPVSNHRSELSVAFSEDDGDSWSDPVVIARVKEGREVAYPYTFEVEPGEVWVTEQAWSFACKNL